MRRAHLAAIHVGARQLDMDDLTYRALLVRVAGHDSAAKLTRAEREAVLDEMRRLGALRKPGQRPRKTPGQYPGKPPNFDRLPGEIEKVEALLADMKLPWSYADAIGQQMFGVPRISWLRKDGQVRAVLAALHVEQEKRRLNELVDYLLCRLGSDRPTLVLELWPNGAPPGWARDRRLLKQVWRLLLGRCAAAGLVDPETGDLRPEERAP